MTLDRTVDWTAFGIWLTLLLSAHGDDVLRVSASTRTIAVIMPNEQGIRSIDWRTYLTTVDEVEQLTGYDFFTNVRDAVENAIEAGKDGANPPGVAGQSVSTDEDHAIALTLEVASASGTPIARTALMAIAARMF